MPDFQIYLIYKRTGIVINDFTKVCEIGETLANTYIGEHIKEGPWEQASSPSLVLLWGNLSKNLCLVSLTLLINISNYHTFYKKYIGRPN